MRARRRTLRRTFAAELLHFVEAVDIVDDQTFRDVRDLVWKYLKDQLDADYFELMGRVVVGGEEYIKAHWSSRDENLTWSIRDRNGDFTNPITEAFERRRSLWLVSPNGSPLAEAAKVEDQWSNLGDLSAYSPFVQRPIRTAIVVQLPSNQVPALYFIETKQAVTLTEIAQEELVTLAEAIDIVLDLNRANRTQSRLTRQAIAELRGMLDAAEFPKLAKPRLFFAFSDRADRAVVDMIKGVLSEFRGQLDVHDWDQMRDSGNIPTQLTHSIARSKFGVCYLSEPGADSNGQRQYIDNPNVVFESGMLQAQTNDYASEQEPAGWIPIRERNSPQAPFDFASERMVIIPRVAGGGDLDRVRLAEELRQRIKALLRE